MWGLSSWVGSAVGASKTLYDAAALLTWGASSDAAAKTRYFDWGYVFWKAIKLNFREPGTKITLGDHEMTFSHPKWYQGAVRSYGGEGATWEALHNLTTPLYYAIMRLDPIKNPSVRLPFLLAWRGIHILCEKAYADDPTAQQYLTTTHLRMFKETFQGRTIRARDYRIQDWARNPLLSQSDQYWMTGGKKFEKINRLYMQALVEQMKGQSPESSIQEADVLLNPVITKIRSLVQSIVGGGSADSQEYDFTHPMSNEKMVEAFKRKGGKSEVETLHTYLWPMLKQVAPENDPGFWVEMGIPIPQDAESQRMPPAAFWEWLGLPLPAGQQSSVLTLSVDDSVNGKDEIKLEEVMSVVDPKPIEDPKPQPINAKKGATPAKKKK